ncbi:hypothetical protein XccvBFoX4_gp06 [Xanthomonas phage FoX4]|uniref:Uncharacterized protein n=1 Tax=Xanthomonas phage FoX4 TaxID=2723900 RepID=A0A858WJT3_9CAUD|nr:hypothetical protein KNU97_gp06 [Xanthomonas phage FoX4]QJI52960.1 hypothetical protein XccvBFoX4_gp06 [Xanthomonas phage FoX4]
MPAEGALRKRLCADVSARPPAKVRRFLKACTLRCGLIEKN